MTQDASGFDYIIVGSGAGGGPLAARLVANSTDVRVLVLEAGPNHVADDTPAREVSLVPSFHGLSTEHEDLSWEFFVKHYSNPPAGIDPKAHPRPDDPRPLNDIFYPRSSGLGGCTVHNAMITIAGPDSDWDDLADFVGDHSWRGGVMRGYFQRLERNEYLRLPTPPPTTWWGRFWDNVRWLFRFTPDHARGKHGFSGWLHTSTADVSLGLGDRQLKGVLGGALVQARRAGLDRAWTLVRRFVKGNIHEALDPNHAQTQAESPEGVVAVPLAVCGTRTSIHQNSETPFVMRGRRSSPREFLLETKAKCPDRLEIWTDVLVTGVLFEDPEGAQPRAVGVSFQKGSRLYRATRRRVEEQVPPDGEPGTVFVKPGGEIVLAGGAFNTPQLLMLSGIGDTAHLDAIGSSAPRREGCVLRGSNGQPLRDDSGAFRRIHVPGVGVNLQDRYEVTLISEMRQPFSVLNGATFTLPGNMPPDRHLKEWRARGRGLYTTNGSVLGIFKRSRPDLEQPDLFIFGIPLPFRGYDIGYSAVGDEHQQFTWAILKGHTRNTDGTVRLRSADPRDTPDINFHYFNELTCGDKSILDPDLAALVEGVKFVRGIADQSRKFPLLITSFGPRLGEEIHPGYRDVPDGDEEAMKAWIRRVAWGHHACGTCRMGPEGDENAVLDSRFRVRGVAGLRVVDASIFPKIPGYFVVTNIYMASEKAADVLLEDRTYGRADAPVYPLELRAREAAAIAERRKNVATRPDEPALEPAPIDHHADTWSEDVTGLALSGGGVRSATFNLGVLQALARCRWLRRVDFLSTVSGGGYVGSFLGRWFDRLRPHSEWGGARAPIQEVPDRIERELNDEESPAIRWLRANGNYLAPQGGADVRTDAAVFLRNFLSVHFVVGALLFALLGTLDWVRYRLFDPVFAVLLYGWQPVALGGVAMAIWTVVFNLFASPWLLLAGLVVLFTVVPKIAAYWIVSQDRHGRFSGPPLLALLVIVTGLLLEAWLHFNLISLIAAIALLTSFLHAELAWWRGRRREEAIGRGSVETQRLRTRNQLTIELGGSLRLTLVALAFAVIDALGHGLQQRVAGTQAYVAAFGAMTAAMTALAPITRWVAKLFAGEKTGSTSALRGLVKAQVAAGMLAAILFAVPLVTVSLVTHLAYDGGVNVARGLALTLFAWVLSIIFAHPRALAFVNRSSLAQTYGARIARAYLGASNPVRHRPQGANVTEVVAGDDVASIRDYEPFRTGGPFHLINTTVNQTIDFTSQRGNRDRKGDNLAVSCVAMTVGERWHAEWKDRVGPVREGLGRKRPSGLAPIGYHRGGDHPLVDETGRPANHAEMLSLRQWVAISGAAVGPGMGQTTKAGTALLYGLANLRTGYWWNSGITDAARDGFPVVTFFRRLGYVFEDIFLTQSLLIAEWLARFPGPWNRFWHISDGGFFEVLGAYELIRRRVPRIIVCDGSADPQYQMESVANLMRKVRIDFGATIEPFTADQIAKHVPEGLQGAIGTLDDLRPTTTSPTGAAVSTKHAALFWVHYSTAPARPSVLLYVKASVTGDESTDVLHYRTAHADFPHEGTSDQVFDEEQWESYRCLGEHVLSPLCGAGAWFWSIPLESA